MPRKKHQKKNSAKSKNAAIQKIFRLRVSPTATKEERLITYGMAQTEVNDPYLWRKIIALD